MKITPSIVLYVVARRPKADEAISYIARGLLRAHRPAFGAGKNALATTC
jgi:hypothetical protein